MRARGLVADPAGAPHADHLCWVYDDPAAFADVARRYLDEGLARGERLLWVGEDDGAVLGDLDRLRADGRLQVLGTGVAYERAGAFTPEQQFAFYDAATREALSAGYTGLRVIAEVSALAADPERRGELVRWEHMADEFIDSGAGMVALCAYRRELGPEALTDVTTVHPLVHAPAGSPPFRIWFDRGTVTIGGSLDTFAADRLERILAGTPVGGPVVAVDLTEVDFVDVGGCRTLARWARRLQDHGARLEVIGASRVLQRMWRILGFDDLAEVTFRS